MGSSTGRGGGSRCYWPAGQRAFGRRGRTRPTAGRRHHLTCHPLPHPLSVLCSMSARAARALCLALLLLCASAAAGDVDSGGACCPTTAEKEQRIRVGWALADSVAQYPALLAPLHCMLRFVLLLVEVLRVVEEEVACGQHAQLSAESVQIVHNVPFTVARALATHRTYSTTCEKPGATEVRLQDWEGAAALWPCAAVSTMQCRRALLAGLRQAGGGSSRAAAAWACFRRQKAAAQQLSPHTCCTLVLPAMLSAASFEHCADRAWLQLHSLLRCVHLADSHTRRALVADGHAALLGRGGTAVAHAQQRRPEQGSAAIAQ